MSTRILTSLGVAFANAAWAQANGKKPLNYGNTWVARRAADMIDHGQAHVPLNGINNINSSDAECVTRLKRMGMA